ncbi:MAG: sulfatase [Planctomycetota bacterium]
MHRTYFLPVAVCGLITLLLASSPAAEKPNVVLIVCDDLNDFVTGMGGHPQARTPNLARLAESGVAFHRAYSNNPICAPSRSSFLTGIYPHVSRNFSFEVWFEKPVLKNSKTMMEHFRDNGYHVVGSGKVLHHDLRSAWDEYEHKADYGPFVFDGKDRVAHPSVPEPYRSIGPVDGSFAPLSDVPYAGEGGNKGWIYGTWGKTEPMRYVNESDRDPTPDERNARWAASRIRQFSQQKNDKPFFLAVGFIRPHTPLHVPKCYFDMFPLNTLELPVIRAGDADDCHYLDVFDADQKGPKYFRLLKESYPTAEAGLKAFCQAYLASIAAVDDCIGQVVAAVDASPLRDNTIVVVTSDHGWNMGQKDYVFKNSLWEESTRVPLVIRAPGVSTAGGIAEHPVSLIDLYPTFVDLCGLQGDTRKSHEGAPLDGHSLRPFLENPKSSEWSGPNAALSMIYAGGATKNDPTRQHWSVRTARWRYILYNNGAEELYDHENDPYEWTNLAEDSRHAETKASLKAKLMKMTGR